MMSIEFKIFVEKIAQKFLFAHKGNINWDIICRGGDVDTHPHFNQGIYRGTSGVALFFTELYLQYPKAQYAKVLKSYTNWVDIKLPEHIQHSNASFFSGAFGTFLVLFRISKIFRDRKSKSLALKIAKKIIKDSDKIDNQCNDLLSGVAGQLLGLMHIHSVLKDAKILKKIETLTQKLIERSKISSTGLYWDLTEESRHGLCSFSHGSSGIGFVFLEMGGYFNNHAFYELANQAFRHEAAYYIDKKKNWIDLRCSEAEFDKQYQNYKTHQTFNKDLSREMVAWCNGAPGILLFTMKLKNIIRSSDIKKINSNCVDKTLESLEIYKDVSICHGFSGNALILVRYANYTNQPKIAIKVNELALKYISNLHYLYPNLFNKKCGKFDESGNSLFLGPLGLGYFLLQSGTGKKSFSVLMPELQNQSGSSNSWLHSISGNELFDIIVRTSYPKTSYFLMRLGVVGFIDNKINPQKKILPNLINKVIKEKVVQSMHPVIKEAYKVELTKMKILTRHQDYIHESIRIKAEYEENHKFLNNKKGECLIKISTNAKLLRTKWSWASAEWASFLNQNSDYHFILLLQRKDKIFEFTLDIILYTILSAFIQPGTYFQKINEISKKIEKFTSINKDIILNKIENQIDASLKAGVLSIQFSNDNLESI